MTEPNLYNVGYDVGFEDGFKEAQARVLDDLGDDPEIMAASRAEWAARAKAAEAKLKSMAMDIIAADLSIEMSSDRIKELEERLEAATDDAKEAEAYAGELEATLRKLEYWFDTDQEILDVMGNNEKADHMRKLKLIRDTLTGGKDE